ncbi:unnamed protein product, partial [Adineta ricciae]
YKQWSAVYRASLEPYCTTPADRETPGQEGGKYFGGSLELLWHVILGLHPVNMAAPIPRTNTDPCHTFRSSCKNSPCTEKE